MILYKEHYKKTGTFEGFQQTWLLVVEARVPRRLEPGRWAEAAALGRGAPRTPPLWRRRPAPLPASGAWRRELPPVPRGRGPAGAVAAAAPGRGRVGRAGGGRGWGRPTAVLLRRRRLDNEAAKRGPRRLRRRGAGVGLGLRRTPRRRDVLVLVLVVVIVDVVDQNRVS